MKELTRCEMKKIIGGDSSDDGTCPLNCGTGCTEENRCKCLPDGKTCDRVSIHEIEQA